MHRPAIEALVVLALFLGCTSAPDTTASRGDEASGAEVVRAADDDGAASARSAPPEGPPRYQLVLPATAVPPADAYGDWTGIVLPERVEWAYDLSTHAASQFDPDERPDELRAALTQRCATDPPPGYRIGDAWDVLVFGRVERRQVVSCELVTFGGTLALALDGMIADDEVALALPPGDAPRGWVMRRPDTVSRLLSVTEQQELVAALGLWSDGSTFVNEVRVFPARGAAPELVFAAGELDGALYSVLVSRNAVDGRYAAVRAGTEGGELPPAIAGGDDALLGWHTFRVVGVVEGGGRIEILTRGSSVGEDDLMLHRFAPGRTLESVVLFEYSDGG